MTSREERLVQWLRDAHAMEEQAIQMLTSTASRIERYPELKARIEQHTEETRRQADLIRSCLERRSEGTSTLKDLAGKVTATGQALSGLFTSDEVVKASMASYTFEHMEIAAYRALIAAADSVGDAETKRVCEQILAEEETMAAWLADNLPAVTRRYLELELTPGAAAKR